VLTALLAAALLAQDGGLSDEDLARMNREWMQAARQRDREEGRVDPKLRPVGGRQGTGAREQGTGARKEAPRPSTLPLRGPRSSYNRPFVPIGAYWRPPQMMPSIYTVPPFIRR
jgi:hypothetical protein